MKVKYLRDKMTRVGMRIPMCDVQNGEFFQTGTSLIYTKHKGKLFCWNPHSTGDYASHSGYGTGEIETVLVTLIDTPSRIRLLL